MSIDPDTYREELLAGDIEPHSLSDYEMIRRHRQGRKPARVQRSIQGHHLIVTVDGRSFVRPSHGRFVSVTVASDKRWQVCTSGDDVDEVITRTTAFTSMGIRPVPFVVVDLDTFEVAHEVAS